MMDARLWVVGVSNTIHLLATVVWIGWSALLALAIAPRAAEAHGAGDGWLPTLARRGASLAYGALAALGATGMVQMGAHPQYEGLFSLSNLWSGLLFIKHALILGSVALIVLLGQTISPRLRLAARRAVLGQPTDTAPLLARFRLLARLNLAAGLAVLLITGFMTAIR